MPPPYDLIFEYLDGELSPDRKEELLDWLAAGPENVRTFVREAHLHSALRNVLAGRLAELEAEGLPREEIELSDAHGSVFSIFRSALRRRLFWSTVASALMLALVGLLFWLRSPAQAWLICSNPGARLLRGNAQVPVKGKALLRPGDVIFTGDSSDAAIEFPWERTRLDLSARTILRLNWTGSAKAIQLDQGVCYGSVGAQRFGRRLQFLARNATATVLGTELKLSAFQDRTELEVYSGTVRLKRSSNGEAVVVSSGFSGVIADGQPISNQRIAFDAGSIRLDYWWQVPGTAMSDFTNNARFPDRSDSVSFPKAFETARSNGDNYGARLRGYLRPPRTGEYEFWIAADDLGELWLSPTEEIEAKERICFARTFTGPHDWDSSTDQKSRVIHLIAGRKYYIEALLKEVAGDDGLAVAWKGLQFDRQVISGEYLSPSLERNEKK